MGWVGPGRSLFEPVLLVIGLDFKLDLVHGPANRT